MREHSEEGPLGGTLPQERSSLQLTGEPVMVQRKKKPSGAQRKRLRKRKEASYNSYRPPEVLTSSRRLSYYPGKKYQGLLLVDGLWAHLRPGSTKDNFASTETGNWKCI